MLELHFKKWFSMAAYIGVFIYVCSLVFSYKKTVKGQAIYVFQHIFLFSWIGNSMFFHTNLT